MTYRYQPVLKHHGILGMKWGVRRFRNEDGSLTPLGKIRAKDDDAVRQARIQLQVANGSSGGNLVYNRVRRDAARKQLQDAKVLRQLHSHKKSNRQQKLEQKYLDKGMTPQEAEIAAYKRVKTEKVLLAVGALTVTAAAAYATRKHFKEDVDRYIDSNVKLKRVAANDNMGVHDAFYASYKKGDVNTYVGLYGATTRQRNGQAFQKTMSTKGLNVAGNSTGKKVLNDLIKTDPRVRSDLKQWIETEGKGSLASKRKAYRMIDAGKVPKNAYDLFNQNLVYRTPSSQSFYNALKRRGYDAVLDVNDMKYSGYKAKAPIIVFNKSQVSVDKVRKLNDDEINYNLGKYIIKQKVGNAAKQIGIKTAGTAAGGAAIGKAVNAIATKNNQKKAISQYKKEHPGTKLSDNEILENIIKR